jgi:hypothetical protein
MTIMLFLVKKFPSERMKCETVRCHDATATSFVPKVGIEVFEHFHVVAINGHSSISNLLFGLPG